jgi:transposase
MARYKQIDMSPKLLPVVLEDQLVPSSFAHAVHHLVDQLDLSDFDDHYRNDKAGYCAYAPSILLKAVLLAYSQGIISSRGI